MSPRRRRDARWSPALALAGALLAGCADPGAGAGPAAEVDPEDPTPPAPPGPDDGQLFPPGALEGCFPDASVKGDGSSLIVRDPEVLARFTLKRVLQQLIDLSTPQGPSSVTPEEMLQRLFDTENTTADGVFEDVVHCDSPENRAFANGAPIDCPRAEGVLAMRDGLLVPGDPDYFAPVALVNRLDLMPSSLQTCGEYRIVFAKQSGRTDPEDRVFLIFEGALSNPSGGLMSCLPVVRAWEDAVAAADPATIATRLEGIYFYGLPGFPPVVHPEHFGLLSNEDAAYGGTRGQVRISQRMQEPWEMRELRFVSGPAYGPPMVFAPATVKGNPMGDLFDPSVQTDLQASFRFEIENAVGDLGAAEPERIRMQTANFYNAGESALGGAAGVDYEARASGYADLKDGLTQRIADFNLNAECPPDDPLTAAQILRRATTQTCAGCHAPAQLLGPDREIGCGLTWPDTLGGAHIDEEGALSPALTDVFLPHRASVATTYLKGCDQSAIWSNLVPVPPGDLD